MCNILDYESVKPISDGQLRRLLASVDAHQLYQFHCRYFGWSVCLVSQGSWLSLDGKELRGTIEGCLGQKRGLCLVHLVSHQGMSVGSCFYSGQKESEIVSARNLLSVINLSNCGVTLDALHCQVETLEMVVNQAGVYVVEAKANQAQLCADLTDHVQLCQPLCQLKTYDKAHGRLEERTYRCYDLSGVCFEARWQDCQFRRLVVVDRHFTQLKSGQVSQEQSLYLSNSERHTDEQLCQAIRGHWSIEAGHWVRDVSFREDKIRCSHEQRMKNLSLLMSVSVNLTKQYKVSNIKAFHEELNANPLAISKMIRHF
jgi:predicted transposase YbfD/YdcC